MADIANVHNYPVREVYGGYNAWVIRPLVRIFTFIVKIRGQAKNSSAKEQTREYRKSIDRISSRNWFLNGLFVNLILWDYAVQIFLKITIPLWKGENVLSDRYVFDTTVNVADNLHLSSQQHLALMRKWLKYFPRPDLVIWVVTPASICLERKDDIPSPDYILKRMDYYESMTQHISVDKLDGTSPIREVERWAEETIERILT